MLPAARIVVAEETGRRHPLTLSQGMAESENGIDREDDCAPVESSEHYAVDPSWREPVPNVIGLCVDAAFKELHGKVLIERPGDDGQQEAHPHGDHPPIRNILFFGDMQDIVSEGQGQSQCCTAQLNVGLGIVAKHRHDLMLVVEIVGYSSCLHVRDDSS